MAPVKLRVGVPRELIEHDRGTGDERVWREVLARLGGLADVHPLGARRGLRRMRCDVVLASGHRDLPRDLDAPLVVQVHEAPWDDAAQRRLLAPEFVAPMRARGEAAVRAACRVLTAARSARREIAAAYGLTEERIDVVPHGVDPERFHPGIAGGRELVARARGGAPAPYVLFVSALHPRKNSGALREAMAGLARRGLPHVLVLAGVSALDRADPGELEAAATAELPGAPGRVVRIVKPADADVAALMAGASAFCLPSLGEGFGLTALEAMASGTPVVVSDRGALPEVVGEAGLCVAPEPAALEEALARVLTDPALAARLTAAGRERAAGLTWSRTAEGWLASLERAAAAAR
jgi:glycosyltransferase involved in cell wall biosynthesis